VAHVTVIVTVTVDLANHVNHVNRVKTDQLKSHSKMNSRVNFVLNSAILVPIHVTSVVATVIVAVARDLQRLPLLP
jgi:hypothetical protein